MSVVVSAVASGYLSLGPLPHPTKSFPTVLSQVSSCASPDVSGSVF